MIKNIKLVLLDLDGVLFDTKKNMHMSWKKVQIEFKIRKKFKQYFKHIGMPFNKILKNLSIDKDLTKIHKIYQKESIRNFNKIKLYSGVKNTLENLSKRKIIIGVVTSKDKIRTLKLIKKFKLNIKYIVPPSKKLRGKPFPDQLVKAIKLAKINCSNTIYLGDMLVDFKAAKNSKINFVYAEYGYGKKYSFYKYSIKKFKDSAKII